MINTKLGISEFARNLADFINRVSYRGELFTIYRGNKVVAELRPAPLGSSLGELPKLVSLLPQLSETQAEEYLQDIEKHRSAQKVETLRDPWE